VATVELTQVALSGGFWVSYFRLFNMHYFDAASGKVFDLNTSYNVPQDETDPASIPGKVDLSNIKLNAQANGRGTLIPGFLKGIEAVNRRFGKLPFENMFAPAIFYAENGFTLTPLYR
jgi:gamma-glutamyltranspeptidase/glutathione hydrolase